MLQELQCPAIARGDVWQLHLLTLTDVASHHMF